MTKHSLFAAPLLLMTLSVVCQAQPMTRRFVVETEKKPSFNPMKQKELGQDHPFAAIIMMPGSGNARQQHPPSESSGQQTQGANACPAGSFSNSFYSDSADGSEGSQQLLHTLGLDCFVFPCHGVCQ
ncbi:hypothetical protein, partial [Endozoicomonas sp. SESOKO2]|uniref:hypothetical protein n=1 Tax=Endozoicomonas sp. SESOKO2 TaxID=2828743 RepID=UPI00214999A5